MYDDIFNPVWVGGVHPPHEQNSFVFLKWSSEQSFLRHIFKSKLHSRLAFAHPQITHFELGLDFTDIPIFLAF